MVLFVLSFLAGVLTIAAPCVLPLLPVIIGGSIVDDDTPKREWVKPLVIVGSLALSVIVFTLLLKASTSLLGIPVMVWQIIAGTIVTLLGLQMLLPGLWEKVTSRFNFLGKSYVTLGKAERREGYTGAVLTGAALGPVFTSCSPTYAFIVAVSLPASFALGFSYLIAYAIGLSVMLLLVAYLGRAFVQKLGWLSDPHGTFRKVVGVLFITVGIVVIFGFDKDLQTYILDQGWYAPISDLEENLRN